MTHDGGGGVVLHLQESYETLMDTLDANKTTSAFPVVARGPEGEAQIPPAGQHGDFKGIISRTRWGGEAGVCEEGVWMCVAAPLSVIGWIESKVVRELSLSTSRAALLVSFLPLLLCRCSIMELLDAFDKDKQKAATAAAADSGAPPEWTIAAQRSGEQPDRASIPQDVDPPAAGSLQAAAAAADGSSGGSGSGGAASSSSSAGREISIDGPGTSSSIVGSDPLAPSTSSSSDPAASAAAGGEGRPAAAAAATEASAGSSSSAAAQMIDLSAKVEVAPVVIPPGMPLSFVYHIMQEQGLNYVPVIRHHGPLEGMVTRLVQRAA